MPNSSRSRPSKRYPAHTRKGRVQRKMRRAKQRRRKVRQSQVQYTSRALTAYGFFYPMATFLLEVLHLKEAFASQISLVHQGKDFTVADFCITLVILPILGIERISHIDEKLRAEGILAAMLGMTRVCTQKTLHSFLNRCSGWQVRQVVRITTDLIGAQVKAVEQHLDPQELRILDIDGSTRSTEGRKREKAKPGKNTKAKGKDCYLWSVGVFCGVILHQILDSGNVHCKHHLKPLLDQIEKMLARIDLLRIDGGYLLGVADLNFLLEKPYAFLTKVKANLCSVQQAMAQASPGDWQHVNKSTAILDAGGVLLFPGATEPVRLMVVRARRRIKRTKKGRVYYRTTTLFYGLVTNLQGDTFFFQGKARKCSALWIFRLYKKRWTIENTFKAVHQAFNTGKLPSQRFRANQCYLGVMTIAYNATVLFQRPLLTQQAQRWMWTTVRRRLLCVPALVDVTDDTVGMTFHQDFPYKTMQRLAVIRLARLLDFAETTYPKSSRGHPEQHEKNQILMTRAA